LLEKAANVLFAEATDVVVVVDVAWRRSDEYELCEQVGLTVCS
jgi:hypothetical protein